MQGWRIWRELWGARGVRTAFVVGRREKTKIEVTDGLRGGGQVLLPWIVLLSLLRQLIPVGMPVLSFSPQNSPNAYMEQR